MPTPRSAHPRVALLLTAPACAGWVEMMQARPYTPLVVPGRESRETIFARAQASTLAWNATSVEVSQRDHRLTAIIDRDATMRDWVVVEVSDRSETAITVRTEIADGRGQWISTPNMCGSYSYAREKAIAREIFSAAPRPLALARSAPR